MITSAFQGFLIGVFVTVVILIIYACIYKKSTYRNVATRKNSIENVLILVAILAFVSTVLGQALFGSLSSNFMAALITTLSTVLFSWLITKKTSAAEYRDRLKNEASTAYRHNKSLLIKIEYEIKLIDRIFVDNVCNKDGRGCEHINTLYRIRDALINFKRDCEENLCDWANIIAVEVRETNKMIDLEKELKQLYYKSENYEDDGRLTEVQFEIAAKKEAIEKLKDNFDGSVEIYEMLLDNERKFTNEMDQWIREEVIKKESEKIKEIKSINKGYEKLCGFLKEDASND